MALSRPLLGASLGLCVAFASAACTPSATVRRTTPIANLKVYQSVLIRVAAQGGASGQVPELGRLAADRIRARCQFGQVFVDNGGSNQPDLIMDLNILRSFRGGDGVIQNPNLAVVDVAVVLSDGLNDELLGSAEIRGKSSAVLVSGVSPESQAVDIVATKISEIMSKSGCTGPRVARAPEEPEEPIDPPPDGDAGPGEPTGPTEEEKEQANALNDEGKDYFRAANIPAAKEKFEAAIALWPSAKYLFNLCLAQESLKEYDAAVETCQAVIDKNSTERLNQKASERLEIIREKQAGE